MSTTDEQLVREISLNEAIDAVVDADFVTSEGRHITHSIRGGLGADWDTEEVIRHLREESTRIAFCKHYLYGWCLATEEEGRHVVIFDNVRPLPRSEKEAREQ